MEHPSLDEPAATSTTKWNEFDELTLSVMANRNHYDKYTKKSHTQTRTLADMFHKEQMYYKERILDMTRDLFDKEEAMRKCSDNDVLEAYNAYMKCCIRYLKWKDVTEMIQNEKYSTNVEIEAVADARQELDKRIQEIPNPVQQPVPAPDPEQEPEQEPDIPSPPSTNYNEKDRLISFANKMCIRKKTMDDFIVVRPAPVASTAHLPQIRDYYDEVAKRAIATNDQIQN